MPRQKRKLSVIHMTDEEGNSYLDMNFFGRGSNTPPPSSAPYSRVPDNNSGYNTPTGYNTPRVPRLQQQHPSHAAHPGGYNDPSNTLFEKRPLDRRPPPRASNLCVSSSYYYPPNPRQQQLLSHIRTLRRTSLDKLLDRPSSRFPTRPAYTPQ